MVQMNVEIGQKLSNIKCCNKSPKVVDYFENYHSFRIGYKCLECGCEGGFGMNIPQQLRQETIRETNKLINKR